MTTLAFVAGMLPLLVSSAVAGGDNAPPARSSPEARPSAFPLPYWLLRVSPSIFDLPALADRAGIARRLRQRAPLPLPALEPARDRQPNPDGFSSRITRSPCNIREDRLAFLARPPQRNSMRLAQRGFLPGVGHARFYACPSRTAPRPLTPGGTITPWTEERWDASFYRLGSRSPR